jgi:hypothetical protein
VLKLLAAPLAGAAALLVCALALGIDPLVAAIVGALVWAGVQLVWGPAPGDPRDAAATLSPGQRHQVDTARARAARIGALADAIGDRRIADRLDAVARRADTMIGRLHADPGQFELFRKALGNYLAQVEDLGARLRDGQVAGGTDAAMADRAARTLERLDALFAAVETRGKTLDRIDLDARIAVLEAEIDTDLAKHDD